MELRDFGTSTRDRAGDFVGRNAIPSHGKDGARTRIMQGRLGGPAGERARDHNEDCLYVALAEREGCELVTADSRLLNSLQPSFPALLDLASLP